DRLVWVLRTGKTPIRKLNSRTRTQSHGKRHPHHRRQPHRQTVRNSNRGRRRDSRGAPARHQDRPDDFGLMSYDPAFTNTASCRSKVTFIDGEKGILRYRGYPIEELAEHSNYLEVAYLVVKGELPNEQHYRAWEENIKTHTMVHENLKNFMQGFRYDAHPMGMLVGTIGAMSTFYPDAKEIMNLESRRLQTRRLIGKMPTLAAWAYRHTRGLPYVYPDNDLSYAGNFLSMLFKMTELRYKPNPTLERTLDILFTLHADHEQNCSANA